MLTLGQLLDTPVDAPTHEACPVCGGGGTARSEAWQEFVAKYDSTDTLRTCHHAVDKARTLRGKKPFEVLWKPSAEDLVEAGLSPEMAHDFVAKILQQPNSVPCSCDDGQVLTPYGQALTTLKEAFTRL